MRSLKSRLAAAIAVAMLCGASVTAQAACEKGYVATFKVKAGSESTFESLLLALVARVRATEQGNLMYEPYRGASEGEYVMMERYVDSAARDAHGESAVIKELFPKILPLLREPLNVVALSALACGGK